MNPEIRTDMTLMGLNAFQRPAQDASWADAGFPFVDSNHLPRDPAIFTASLPYVISSRVGVAAAVADILDGRIETLLPSGFDP